MPEQTEFAEFSPVGVDHRTASTHNRLLRLFSLRLMVHGRAYSYLTREFGGRVHPTLLSLLELDSAHINNIPPALLAHLSRELDQEECIGERWPDPLSSNLTTLGHYLQLTPLEQRVLGTLSLLEISEALQQAMNVVAEAAPVSPAVLLAVMLQVPKSEIRNTLHAGSRLTTTGLVGHGDGRGATRAFRRFEGCGYETLSLLPDLSSALLQQNSAPEAFFSRYLRRVDTNDSLHSFPHYEQDQQRIVILLRHALQNLTPGVNILISGDPGVGKTEFARRLAHDLLASLYEVNMDSDTGRGLDSSSRFRACQFCQGVLSQRPDAILLVDEMEDLFAPPPLALFSPRVTSFGKGQTNRLLETNRTPTVWIGNSMDSIDRAHLRRFDYILEMEPPPSDVRETLLQDAFSGLCVDFDFIREEARRPELTPAQIAQTGRLAHRLHDAMDPHEAQAALRDQLSRHQQVQAIQCLPPRRRSGLPKYRPETLNITPATEGLVQGLAREGTGSLLLHGCAGTGKTAWAEYLADQLGRKLITRPASELINKFVGETEKNIAKMFREAYRQRSVLLLDEADSLLRSRESAHQRWEVTETNELLVQMERFEGIFLCATNLLDAFDPATMRRFDIKLHFHFPNADQRWMLFLDLLTAANITPPKEDAAISIRQQLDRIDDLAHGDFAAIARRFRIHQSDVSVEDILDWLAMETNHKTVTHPSRQLGFL